MARRSGTLLRGARTIPVRFEQIRQHTLHLGGLIQKIVPTARQFD